MKIIKKNALLGLLTALGGVLLFFSCQKENLVTETGATVSAIQEDLIENSVEKSQTDDQNSEYEVLINKMIDSKDFIKLNNLAEKLYSSIDFEYFDLSKVRDSDKTFDENYIQKNIKYTKFTSSKELKSLITSIELNLNNYENLFPELLDNEYNEKFIHFIENEPLNALPITQDKVLDSGPGDCKANLDFCRLLATVYLIGDAFNGNGDLLINYNNNMVGCWNTYSSCLLNMP